MLSSDQDLIKQHQISTLKNVLQKALNYHFSNFKKLEKRANPYPEGQESRYKLITRMKANSEIKLEVQAYINHLRRLKHLIKYLQKNKRITEPTDADLKQTWNDLMQDAGMINLLANKWAAHRAIDDPKGETKSLHLEVLLNLEGEVTMWGEDHLFLSIDKYSFYLCHYHPKAIKFIDWVFRNIQE